MICWLVKSGIAEAIVDVHSAGTLFDNAITITLSTASIKTIHQWSPIAVAVYLVSDQMVLSLFPRLHKQIQYDLILETL